MNKQELIKNENRAWQIHLLANKLQNIFSEGTDNEDIWQLANQIRIASTELYDLLVELEENN